MRRALALVVACVAVGAGGGSARATLLDGPTITPPGNLAEPASTPCGSSLCAVVNFSFSVTGGTRPYTLSCNYTSGQLFPIGTYVITCTATDANGNTSAPASFTLTVAGPPTPPPTLTITPPAAMTIQATLACDTTLYCAIVTYSYTITGGVPPYTLICNLPSGSELSVGSYVISCLGQDREADSTPAQTFDVTITAPTGPPVVSAPPGYVPDVTGCTISNCMGDSLSGYQFDGLTCDFGSFNWNVTSYSCANTPTVTTPVTLLVGNQTNDVAVTFAANGQAVSVASTGSTEQQSGIYYTSVPITLRSGTNVVTATADDPLGRLSPMVYTWTFNYSAPSSGSGPATGDGAPAGGSSTTSAPTSSSGSSSGHTTPAPAATVSATLATASLAAPKIARASSGRETLSFTVKLPVVATVQGTLATAAGRTVLRFDLREPKGRTAIKRSLAKAHVTPGTRLRLRLVIRAGQATRSLSFRFRA